MKSHQVKPEIRTALTVLWHRLHEAQAAYIDAQLRADQLVIPFALDDSTLAAAKEADTQRHAVRDELRMRYLDLFGSKAMKRVEAYFAALDNMYTTSHRYTFVSKIGAAYVTAKLERERAAATVNRIVCEPKVLIF